MLSRRAKPAKKAMIASSRMPMRCRTWLSAGGENAMRLSIAGSLEVAGYLRGEAGAAAAGLRRIRIDEVEALAHEGLFEVEDHAGEVEEGLRVHEKANGLGAAGVVGGLDARAEDEDAIALARLRVKADVVAEA